MATVVRMPEVLANATEAIIQTWLVEVGQEISIGDPIAEIETDKAVVEYAAEVGGVLSRLLADAGATVAIGEPIALVLAPGETATGGESDPLGGEPARDPESGSPVLEAAEPVLEARPVTNGRRLFATPLVRKLARERDIDLDAVTGTGPGGRIVRRDLDRLPPQKAQAATQPVRAPAATARPAETNHVDIPLTGMRRAIARRLTESKTTVPHFYVVADCRVDALLDLRRSVNEAGSTKVSVNDFVLKAVAGALVEVPEANAIWNGDSIRRFSAADIAVAVAVDGGLLTPVIWGVESLTVSAIATQIAGLAARARAGRIQQHELEGGSFSVSNLGMYGVSEFSAILNPPQSGILAVGGATQRPVVVEGELAVGTVMTVTLSADHRVIDGAVAAQWMAAFVRRIENPLTILI
ncbi:dihydrolipoamide acetyltransferase family protein [Mycolicibacterium hippocampi]|uniref:Dihydrolipoamide acetyltransferase component of pyruvate dehydrogenase complex n=1 Tax=Mycolicibacterium hippocampi TaxID=659824 RepID=A0A850Q0F6_9MYCO|nr:dihydrolipoamide acetyltransferase family protein [Mycolicibacterium hippocampi]NVN53710.1 Dihydrolipoamide acetyltransferase component of pyruvate dehydrogenase complex [Mycolicibacterium hippocampi]